MQKQRKIAAAIRDIVGIELIGEPLGYLLLSSSLLGDRFYLNVD